MKPRKSMLEAWDICPRLYEQQWIKKRPQVNGVEMQYGRDFHSRAVEFFKEVDYEKLITCVRAPTAFWLFKPFVPSKGVVAEWVANFLWWEANEWIRLLRQLGPQEAMFFWKPLALEWFYEDNDGEYHVDRIDRLPNVRSLINIEYKTSKWFFKAKLRRELTWYNLGINRSKRFEWPCDFIGYFNPQLIKSFSERVPKWQEHRVQKFVTAFLLANSRGHFPCEVSRFCRYCSYILDCPCWQKNDKEVRNIA